MIKTHMNNMKKYLSLCIMLLCLCSTVMAQQEKVVVKGVVTDEAKEPLIGVNVTGHARFRFNHRHERSLLHNHGTLPPVSVHLYWL